ncbi:hypothetical protein IJH10_01845 [Candidatus Saccharibacteria bacterium]|nr:hypothetical protein [Candidatus Saccharibacteria bacterium]
MKNFKVLMLVLCCFWLLPSLSVRAAEDASSEQTVFESLEEIPMVLDGITEFSVKPEHSAYSTEGYRNKALGSVVSEENGILITFSVPELAGLDNYDIEDYNFGAPSEERKRILMVTAEYYQAIQGSKIAEFWLFVFSPSEEATLNLTLEPNQLTVEMDSVIAEIYASSKEATTIRIWEDDFTKESTRTNVYQSAAAGMSNFASEGWYEEFVDDILFSAGVIDLPLDMRKYLVEYMFDYNESLRSAKERKELYQAMSDFWEDKQYQEFSLDAYVESLGGTVQNPPTDKGDKEYVLNGNHITIGCYMKQEERTATEHSVGVGLDSSWVNWNPAGTKSEKGDFEYVANQYQTTSDDGLEPVQIDDEGHLISRWDFDFIIDLLNYCKRAEN